MRYKVMPVDLPDDHPNWPNERVYKILDLKNNELSFGCYVDIEIANSVCEQKNNQ